MEEARKQIVKINFLRRKRFRKIAGHLLVVQYLEEYTDSHRKDIYRELLMTLQIILFQLLYAIAAGVGWYFVGVTGATFSVTGATFSLLSFFSAIILVVVLVLLVLLVLLH